jgi:Holliday junction resolvasome RuvABC endonuclease subunit
VEVAAVADLMLPGLTPAPVVPAPTAGAAGPTPLVIALDLSLTSTGIAGEGWTDHIRTKQLRGDERLDYLERGIASFIRSADLVATEGPSYGHSGVRLHEDLVYLRGWVRRYCYRHQIPYAVVPPSSLKLYAAGYGKASKGEIRSAIADRYSVHTEGPARYDEADAYGVLAAARDWLGHPLAEVPERQRRALDGCQWPDREAVTAR